MIHDRLQNAFQAARADLLAARLPGAAHWVGELSTSALSTATAVSALSLVADGTTDAQRIERGIAWLVEHQNDDGGWGDTDRSLSNIATTMLAQAAFQLAGRADAHRDRLAAADGYVAAQGSLAGLRRRYGRDKTFAVPILANSALAGLTPWRDVSPLPFELASFPQRLYRFLRMPVVSYAIPALVAIGQLRFFRLPPWNPLWRWYRGTRVEPSLRVLQQMQPESGGYLEAIPLTSFVVMSLAGTGRADHAVARKGVAFLRDTVLADGSWPIDVNLATWLTSLSLLALATGDPHWIDALNLSSDASAASAGGHCESGRSSACLDWLLSCQNRTRHPFTGADPGGWGWTDLSGAVPDADDTPGVLLALAEWRRQPSCSQADRARIDAAAQTGVDWLLGLQNDDGGWPTFCRGWGRLPFDRSGADLTAHALRALRNWKDSEALSPFARQRIERAMRGGWNYLGNKQRGDGTWVPLWFGNQHHPQEENPVYGTAKVLLAYCEAGKTDEYRPGKGLDWLADQLLAAESLGSVEETALAVEALAASAAHAPHSSRRRAAFLKGLDWLIRAVETRNHLEAAPIGLYFAKLWYYEKMYPLVFTVAALGRALAVKEWQHEENCDVPTPPLPAPT